MPTPASEILSAFAEGQAAQLVTGRSIRDLVVDNGELRPLLEVLRQELRERHGMVVATYSIAGGLDWDAPRMLDARDRRTVEQALAAHGLPNGSGGQSPDSNEIARVMRGIAGLSRSPRGSLSWAAGPAMAFAFVLDFSEHLVPGTLINGSQTLDQTVAIELANLTAESLALRASGNLVLFVTSRETLIDELVAGALHHVQLVQPDRDEKLAFIQAAMALHAGSRFEAGLTPEDVAHLLDHTPNRGIETLLRASAHAKRALTAQELNAQKSRDVERLSEGSLTALDTNRAAQIRLCGLNIDVPHRILIDRIAAALKRGDPSTPANVLLAGPPGTGKTDLAFLTAREAGVACYEMHSPKRPYVGQTEQLARHQQQLLKQWTPNLAFTDEITEVLPMQRTDFDGDSGASRAVMGALLAALSDETRRGRSLVVAATNVPHRIGAAMASRFMTIPVLYPLEMDFPEIVAVTAARVDAGSSGINADNANLRRAGATFYAKGASPRHIRAALSNARLLRGDLTPDAILFAAEDVTGQIDQRSTQFADLWAIRCCSSRSFLPWHADPAAYPYPPHLRGVVDLSSGDVITAELNRRIADLEPHANV